MYLLFCSCNYDYFLFLFYCLALIRSIYCNMSYGFLGQNETKLIVIIMIKTMIMLKLLNSHSVVCFHTLRSGFRNTPFSKNLGSDSLKLCYWIAESQHVGISFKIKRSRILSSQQKCAKTCYVVTLFCTNYR